MVLPVPVAIFEQTREFAAVRRNLDADFIRRRGFREPDQSFDNFELAEEEAVGARLRIAPVFEQLFGDAGDARVAALAPLFDARADLID
jgi:hypothetical protein